MTRITALLVATVFALAGCAGGGQGGGEEDRAAPPAPPAPAPPATAPPATQQDPPDDLEACELVTTTEIGTALGSPVGDGEESGLRGCSWKAASGATAGIQVFAGPMLTPKTCEAQKALVSGREEPITGIGDSALWGSSGDLVVCTTQVVIKVDIDNTQNSPDKDREAALAVGRAALGRL